MAEINTFIALMRRVRDGDQDAASDLVRQFEPDLRLAVHVRLTDPGMRRLVDSMDICNSILANFFLRAASGQYELKSPQELFKLLAVMAQNRITDHYRKWKAQKRGEGKVQTPSDGWDPADNQPSPSSVVANRELLEKFRSLLTEEECQIADWRNAGDSWDEIAARVGMTSNAIRMRHDRAVQRAIRELGVED